MRDIRMTANPVYAHRVPSRPFRYFMDDLKKSSETLSKVRIHEPVQDADLAVLDDQLKRGGSLAIATMATLGLTHRVFGVGEYLGFLTWFAAMAITPRVINAMVHWKTGVNLNQQYQSTYGHRVPLYQDPGYLPLHILSDKEINKIADRLKIPANDPECRKKTEDKMRQIATQARTWWMLVAGPATPVLSGLMCDQLQDPATGLLSRLKLGMAQIGLNRRIKAEQSSEALEASARKVLDQIVGQLPESGLSRWWKGFGRGLVKKSGMDSLKGVVKDSHEGLMQKLVNYWQNMAESKRMTFARDRLENSLQYLRGQHEALDRLEQAADKVLAPLTRSAKDGEFLSEPLKGKLDDATLKRLREDVRLGLESARTTVRHHERFFTELLAGQTDPVEIRRLIEKPTFTVVQKHLEAGNFAEAKKLVDKPEVFHELKAAVKGRQFNKGARLMGASPENAMIRGLQDFMKRRMWRRRIIGGLGGGLLAATVLFNHFVLGRDFKKEGGK